MSSQDIICGAPQGFILAPLLFILYVNDLRSVSNALGHIFANDTNLFVSDKSINTLFTKAVLELQKMNEQFKANKLSLNTKESVFFRYHISNQNENLPVALPIQRIHGVELKKENIKKKKILKFLGVFLGKHYRKQDPKKHQLNIHSKLCISIITLIFIAI